MNLKTDQFKFSNLRNKNELKNKVSETFGMLLNMPLTNAMWASEQGDKKEKQGEYLTK